MSLAIVTAASDPSFYMRVSFAALKVAQSVAAEGAGQPNRTNRAAYANRVLCGDENAILLAQHVATDAVVGKALQDGGAEAPKDADIEKAIAAIWDARSNALANALPVPSNTAPPPVKLAG